MKTIKIYGSTVDDKTLHSVVDILKDGGIVVYPTDTLYAIGCDALNNNAINKICKLKGINPDKQFLSIVCDSISMAAEYAKFDNAGFKLLKRNVKMIQFHWALSSFFFSSSTKSCGTSVTTIGFLP